VEDHLHMLAVGFQELEQLFGMDDVGQFALGDVLPLVVRAQAVADHQLAGIAGFQGGKDVRADEAGSSGDDDHVGSCSIGCPGGWL
jgi:hypothetical protein